nr:hypothetical protein [Actinomycetes bacterium]
MSTEADGSTADDSKFLAQRVAELSAGDPQFAAARPSATIAAAIEKSAPVLPAVIRTTLEGYADRPALGRRAVQFVS